MDFEMLKPVHALKKEHLYKEGAVYFTGSMKKIIKTVILTSNFKDLLSFKLDINLYRLNYTKYS